MTLSIDIERSLETRGASPRANRRQASHSRSLMGLDWLIYNLLFALIYPAFCLAEWLRRHQAGANSLRAQTSLFSEARENEHIALSYAFIARKTLHQFGREDQAKRPS